MTRFDFSKIFQHTACAAVALWVAFATIDTIAAEGMRKADMQHKPTAIVQIQPSPSEAQG